MHVVARIRDVYSARGAWGLLRFLATRIGHRREDLLYELDLDPAAAPPAKDDGVHVVDRGNVGSDAVADIERQVFVGDNGSYRPGLYGRDLLFAITDLDRKVLTYGFVLFDTSYKRVLGEAIDVPMIGNCYTEPAARGRGLYPRLLRAIVGEVARRGFARVIVSCAPDNEASRRGIEKAGFRRVRRADTIVVLSRMIVWQRSRPF